MRTLLCILVAFLGISSLRAQQILLKSGQRVDTLGVRREGDTVMGRIKVGNSNGEIGYQVAQIARIEFPEPKGLKAASDLLAKGDAEKALAELAPIISYYAPFKDIAGAWWSQAALAKVSALAALRRDTEVEALAGEIQNGASDPEAARAASVRVVGGMIRRQEYDKAAKICDAIIKDSTQPDVLADAWIGKGDIFLAQKEWDNALTAYLHVPVFYRDAKLAMPVALLGSVRAYRRLDDADRAKKAAKELATLFPQAPEVALANAEVQKM